MRRAVQVLGGSYPEICQFRSDSQLRGGQSAAARGRGLGGLRGFLQKRGPRRPARQGDTLPATGAGNATLCLSGFQSRFRVSQETNCAALGVSRTPEVPVWGVHTLRKSERGWMWGRVFTEGLRVHGGHQGGPELLGLCLSEKRG